MSKELLKTLLEKAGLAVTSNVRNDNSEANVEIMLEAQRCLSNIYLQCSRAQNFALENETLPGIMQQTTKYKEYKTPPSIVCFDMKLLFLITAQRPEGR